MIEVYSCGWFVKFMFPDLDWMYDHAGYSLPGSYTVILRIKLNSFFIIRKKWSDPIREWATHSHDGNARLDRTIDDDIIHIQEERNRSDITICHGFFQSTGLMKLSTGGEEPSVNEKRCNNCRQTVKER